MTTAPHRHLRGVSALVSLAKAFIWAPPARPISVEGCALSRRSPPPPSEALWSAPVFLDTAAPGCTGTLLKQALPVTGSLPWSGDEPLNGPALTTQTAKIGLSSPFLKALETVAEWTASSPPSCTYLLRMEEDRSGDYRNISWFQTILRVAQRPLF
jgi:hypothetical protein